jgi:hypothetical protein
MVPVWKCNVKVGVLCFYLSEVLVGKRLSKYTYRFAISPPSATSVMPVV